VTPRGLVPTTTAARESAIMEVAEPTRPFATGRFSPTTTLKEPQELNGDPRLSPPPDPTGVPSRFLSTEQAILQDVHITSGSNSTYQVWPLLSGVRPFTSPPRVTSSDLLPSQAPRSFIYYPPRFDQTSPVLALPASAFFSNPSTTKCLFLFTAVSMRDWEPFSLWNVLCSSLNSDNLILRSLRLRFCTRSVSFLSSADRFLT